VIARAEGFGNHHHQDVGRAASGSDEQFHGVVEAGRVARARFEDWKQVAQIVGQDGSPHPPFVALKPIRVAAQGVDLTVVGDHAKRLSQFPAWEGVGAETLMDDGQGGRETLVGQVGIVAGQLRGEEHALVDHRAARHRTDVEIGGRLAQFGANAVLGPFANDEQAAFEFFVGQPAAGEEELFDDGLGGAGDIAEARIVGGDVAPAKDAEPPLFDHFVQNLAAATTDRRVARMEDHGHAVVARPGQGDASQLGLGGDEFVGNLEEDSGPVAGRLVGSGGASVFEVEQDVEPVADDGVFASARNVDNGADSARIVLVGRVIETRGRRGLVDHGFWESVFSTGCVFAKPQPGYKYCFGIDPRPNVALLRRFGKRGNRGKWKRC